MSQSVIALTALRSDSSTAAEDLREHLLTHLRDVLTAVDAVSADLALLRSEHAGDTDFVDGHAGADIAAFVDTAARSVRAGYAVAVATIENQLPTPPLQPAEIPVLSAAATRPVGGQARRELASEASTTNPRSGHRQRSRR